MKAFIIALTLLVSACSVEQKAALHYANESVKAGNDTKAMLLKQAPCAIDIGAYYRVLNGAERAAIDLLCGK